MHAVLGPTCRGVLLETRLAELEDSGACGSSWVGRALSIARMSSAGTFRWAYRPQNAGYLRAKAKMFL